MLTTHKYDVFLSFRGKDTRDHFISHLFKELDQRNIRPFKDDTDLKSGRRILSGLGCGIKESRFAVVVISVDYPSSSWCLDELVMIMDLVNKKSLTVIPVFYGVDPATLRYQKGEVAEQFKKHKTRYTHERLLSWRQALTSLADISGHCSGKKDDSKLVEDIADSISDKLFLERSSTGTKLIGIDKHMEALYPLLDLNSGEDIRVVGIWGRGSAGKLALASHVCEKIKDKFEAHCFLKNVRKTYHLQQELLSKMKGKCLPTETSHMSPKEIKRRLVNKKVLLVANEVDNLLQLEALADVFCLFGSGSRIIITTGDGQLLKSSKVKWVYEVELLKCYETLPLLRSSALKREDHIGSEESTNSLALKREDHTGFEQVTYRVMSFSSHTFWGL